ncbi:MAG: hypothetical protein JSR57_07545 [Verrucomicrobia bacterium]|nr:hypothetical protein [Verrucomicrobiota bacterium]
MPQSSQPDDHYLLFTHLSIAPELQGQLTPLYPGVYLAPTPYHAVQHGAPKGSSLERHVGLGAWVYPGHGLGMGVCHSCIKVDSSIPTDQKSHYAWVMAGALYLAKPLYMHIGGSFNYSTPEDGLLGRTTNRIDHRSNISLDTFFTHVDDQNLLQYEQEDLERASKYFPLMLKILASKHQFQRAYANLRSFLKGVLWERLRYADSIFAELFSAVDSFAGNPTHKHRNKISTNLSLFLTGVPSLITNITPAPQVYIDRLQSIWDRHRGPCKHGYYKEIPFPIVHQQHSLSNEPELKDLFDLMEINRVAIVKMLLMDAGTFHDYCQIPVPTYVNDEDITQATRNNIAAAFFADNYPTSKGEAFLYTDLIDAAPSKTQSNKMAGTILVPPGP